MGTLRHWKGIGLRRPLRGTGSALVAGLGIALVTAFAFVAGSASAAEVYSCTMGGGRVAAVLTVTVDPISGSRTCLRDPLVPATAPQPGLKSCHATASSVQCILLN
jgi:hypothetical protein